MSDEQRERIPQLIAFDLDYTLWDFWIDTHVTGPLKRKGNSVEDKYGMDVEFYPHVPQILNRIRAFGGTKIAVCSRTSATALTTFIRAKEALSLIPIPLQDRNYSNSAPALKFFDQVEIYPGSKIAHFKQLHRNTGIPYTEMVFYDDEPRNREVESLGVVFILVRHGLDIKTFEKGLEEWRMRQNITVSLLENDVTCSQYTMQ